MDRLSVVKLGLSGINAFVPRAVEILVVFSDHGIGRGFIPVVLERT